MLSFTEVRASGSSPSKVQVIFSLRDSNGRSIVLPAEELRAVTRVFERPFAAPTPKPETADLEGGAAIEGEGVAGDISPEDEGWEELDYVETSLFVRTAKDLEFEVVFVLDFTNSMVTARLPDGSSGVGVMMSAFNRAVEALPVLHRVGVVEFHDRNLEPGVVSGLTTDRDAVKKAVADFAISRYEPGSSRVWDSIQRGMGIFTSGRDTSNIVRALIFISDGRDTSSSITREEAGEVALEDNVQLYAVGIGDVYQREDLREMVQSTGGVFYAAGALEALEEQLRLVISDLVGQYSVSYITLRRSGKYEVRIQVDLPNATGEFETPALDMASFFGLDNVGRIAIDPLTVDRERAEVRTFVRALHVPRNVNRFRFKLDTSKEVSVSLIPTLVGGLLEGWRVRIDPFGYYELSSEEPLAFGKSGLLFGLTFSGVTEKNLEIPVEFDNNIYARGKSFTYPDSILIGERILPGQIAFRTTRTGNSEIFVMNTDGSDQENITNHPDGDFLADWSPDGSRIAFDTDRAFRTTIFIMDRDGTNVRPLVNEPSNNALPSWSPDGNRIVFDSTRDGNREIYVINVVDGGGLTRLTNNSASDWWASWSPNGELIAFNTARDGNAEIYVMAANGADPTNLTNHPGGDFRPVWSPDGQRIAFYSSRDGNREIYVMNADGSDQRNLTKHRGDDWYPTWSPDGNRIAFASFRDANREVYVMRSDGTKQRNLTNHPGEDWAPSWGR